MDEKELIRRIKTSLVAGKSDTEIILFLQGSGYTLEYATLLLKKAKRGKRVLFVVLSFFVFLVILGLLSFFGALTLMPSYSSDGNLEGLLIRNPLEGLNVIFEAKQEALENVTILSSQTAQQKDVYIEDIVVTPEFISYLLQELGATRLKQNPLTGSVPVVNFDIDGVSFYVIIDHGITSHEGFHDEPDISFDSNKVDLVKAMLSSDPAALFRESYAAGRTTLTLEKSEAVLFAKGYLDFYNSLNA